ncbi:MAG: M23 family metallopeptidase [Prevotellaceae bacterium]|jgi:hypothetical protein|nr:M23 family metallopeptidase [Prevotellaceae bacterium]
MRRLLCFVCFAVLGTNLSAQNYGFPLDKPLSMSANFGEIRSNHFHSGIDLRVGGVSGAKVYAVDSGYVSRIYVSPTGFGKALYIEHPNGRSSVYAHLEGFAGAIASYASDYQYKRQRFAMNDYTPAGLLTVKKGELIGYAGNTGSSFGAHLHFEWRETARQSPLNPVVKGFIKPHDTLPPTFHTLALFTLDTINSLTRPRLLKSEKTVKKGKSFVPEKTQVFTVCNPVFLGIHANDYQPANTSKHGIYRMKASIDGEPFFGYRMNGIEFAYTRYINSFIAYDELVNSKIDYVKTYVEAGNILPFYEGLKNRGVLVLNDTLPHSISVEIFDDLGNRSVLDFKIRHSKTVATRHQTVSAAQFISIPWDNSFEYQEEDMEISVEPRSLYSNALFKTAKTTLDGAFSPLWTAGYKTVPLQKPVKLKIKPANLPQRYKQHAFIARQTETKPVCCGGKFDANGFLVAEVSEFGDYYVAIDTIPPKISVASKSGNFTGHAKLTVLISDNVSGIDTCNGYIDNKWALFEYDPKTNSMSYTFDPKQMNGKGKNRKLKVVATDKCNNSTTFFYDFVY